MFKQLSVTESKKVAFCWLMFQNLNFFKSQQYIFN